MNRRQVLALLGTATVGGCLGSESEPDGSTATRTTRMDTSHGTTTDTTTTETTTDETTTTAEPPDVGEPLPSACPVFEEATDRVVCNPGADAPLAMESSAASIALPKGSLSFVLENATETTFSFNPHAWRLHKRVDGEWYYVGPGMWPEPLYFLRPDDTYTWNVTVDNTDLSGEIASSGPRKDLRLRGLGGGTYAFGTNGWFRGESERRIALVTRFDVEGGPLSLTRTDSVKSVERDGETVVVRMPEVEKPRRVTVTRVDDSSGDPERVITEQVIRTTPLRNALVAFEDGVETVRVENVVLTANAALSLDDRIWVVYEGETYRVEMERMETATVETTTER